MRIVHWKRAQAHIDVRVTWYCLRSFIYCCCIYATFRSTLLLFINVLCSSTMRTIWVSKKGLSADAKLFEWSINLMFGSFNVHYVVIAVVHYCMDISIDTYWTGKTLLCPHTPRKSGNKTFPFELSCAAFNRKVKWNANTVNIMRWRTQILYSFYLFKIENN